jgi:ArsR family transcriptional regulator, arsenate/arsenite/antimonite-responsive transcriptional repressor / arsenate reductase (thioredoxin)
MRRVTATASSPDVSPPSFVRLAGHPLRWRLLSELGRSDRQVRELCALIGRPQSLISYHLGRLRTQGLVSMRRSSADRRDAYYSLDLARCRQLVAATGGALHPGLRLAPASSSKRRVLAARPRVLFLCTGNSARSQIAEALVEQLAGGAIDVFSAGSHPRPLHPNAVRAMREHGIDIAGRRSKPLDEFTQERLDYVISLCDRVREVCPEFPARPDLIHWSIPDPAREGDTDEETYPAFQRTANELATRIPFLLELIEHTQATEEAN